MSEDTEIGIDDAVNDAMRKLENDGLLEEGQEGALPQDTQETGEAGQETPATDEKTKPSEQATPEADTPPIEPPASWRSEEKAAFAALDRNTQEIVQRIDQAQQSHFTQRSTELAQEKRAAADERQQYQTERARYQAELVRLDQMATQLLPAKFQDIQSQADYLRLKATDPARASEYEAFQMTLQSAKQQQAQLGQQQLNEHLGNELNALIEKHPEYKDPSKLAATLDTVRKTAVEYYGFNPQEVATILDHRYVDVINDAAAWRSHQANLKAAQFKKTAPLPTKVLQQTASNGKANLATDQKAAVLKRANNASNDREKAEHLAKLFG